MVDLDLTAHFDRTRQLITSTLVLPVQLGIRATHKNNNNQLVVADLDTHQQPILTKHAGMIHHFTINGNCMGVQISGDPTLHAMQCGAARDVPHLLDYAN